MQYQTLPKTMIYQQNLSVKFAKIGFALVRAYNKKRKTALKPEKRLKLQNDYE